MWRDAVLPMSQAANHPAILMFKYSNQVITTTINDAAPVSVISRLSKSGVLFVLVFLNGITQINKAISSRFTTLVVATGSINLFEWDG